MTRHPAESSASVALAARTLPPLPAERADILRVMAEQVYGDEPSPSFDVTVKTVETMSDLAGKAIHEVLEMRLTTPQGAVSVPFSLTRPSALLQPATVLLLNFDRLPHHYCPLEEIVDADVAVCVLSYLDVTTDDDDFSTGVAGIVPRQGPHAWGKISLWAWMASRVMDYLHARADLNATRIWVAGHSRLGKAALLAAARDERFAGAISNNSGCCGAALTRGKVGEQLSDITSRFGYWFTPHLADTVTPEDLFCDQHWLLGAIAPRPVSVGSAVDDEWADPVSEYLSCIAASPAWERHGVRGFVHEGAGVPSLGSSIEGAVRFHLREGTHYLSREDWAVYLLAIKAAHSPSGR